MGSPMSEIITPGDVIAELNRLMGESQKGIQALYDAEINVANLDAEYERAWSLATIEATGTALDRQAIAKLACIDKKLALDIAKAELVRVKTKLRAIDSASVATSVIAKQVELVYRSA